MNKQFRTVSRGQVWYLVDPNSKDYDGSIQGKDRPVLVVSNDVCNLNSPVVHVCPITSKPKTNLPTHVTFFDKFQQTILCEQCRPVKETLFHENSYYKYSLSEDIMELVNVSLMIQFGLNVMPNSDKFWKSVEQIIRSKVKESIDVAMTMRTQPDLDRITTVVDDTLREVKIEIPQGKTTHSPRKWTPEEKKEFVEYCYKHGYESAASHYNMKLGSIYTTKWRFEKELYNETTGT